MMFESLLTQIMHLFRMVLSMLFIVSVLPCDLTVFVNLLTMLLMLPASLFTIILLSFILLLLNLLNLSIMPMLKLSSDKQEAFDNLNGWLRHLLPDYVCQDVVNFLTAMSMLETGYLTSRICRNSFNLFGMKNPKNRLTLSLGDHFGHSFYRCYEDSLHDLLLWLEMHDFIKLEMNDFDTFIHRFRAANYNPSSKYVDTIINIQKTYCYE